MARTTIYPQQRNFLPSRGRHPFPRPPNHAGSIESASELKQHESSPRLHALSDERLVCRARLRLRRLEKPVRCAHIQKHLHRPASWAARAYLLEDGVREAHRRPVEVRQRAIDKWLDGEVGVWRARLHTLQERVAALRRVDACGVEARLEEEAVGVGGDDEVVLGDGVDELVQGRVDRRLAPIKNSVGMQEPERASSVYLRNKQVSKMG
ncbi:hypothetical protein B0H19DRAFT_1144413 [Mycena capillaripes]|nr:hypothetical protein B0H19DRAFT_1144413 [Mycena capillaripes]